MVRKVLQEHSERFVSGGVSGLCLQQTFGKQQVANHITVRLGLFELAKCLFKARRIGEPKTADCPVKKGVLSIVIECLGQAQKNVPCSGHFASPVVAFAEEEFNAKHVSCRKVGGALQQTLELLDCIAEIPGFELLTAHNQASFDRNRVIGESFDEAATAFYCLGN